MAGKMAHTMWLLVAVAMVCTAHVRAGDPDTESSTGGGVESLPTSTVGVTDSDVKSEVATGMVATVASAQHAFVMKKENDDEKKAEDSNADISKVPLGAALSALSADGRQDEHPPVQNAVSVPAAVQQNGEAAAAMANGVDFSELVAPAANASAATADDASNSTDANATASASAATNANSTSSSQDGQAEAKPDAKTDAGVVEDDGGTPADITQIRCMNGADSDCPKGYGCPYKRGSCTGCGLLGSDDKKKACANRPDSEVLKKIDPTSFKCRSRLSDEEDGKRCSKGYACYRKFKSCVPCDSPKIKTHRPDFDSDACMKRETGLSLTKIPAPLEIPDVLKQTKDLQNPEDDADHSDKDVSEAKPQEDEGARALDFKNIACTGNGGCPKDFGCPDGDGTKFCGICKDVFPDDTQKVATCEGRKEFLKTPKPEQIRCPTDDADCTKGFGCDRKSNMCRPCTEVYKDSASPDLIQRCRDRKVFTPASLEKPVAPGAADGVDAASAAPAGNETAPAGNGTAPAGNGTDLAGSVAGNGTTPSEGSAGAPGIVGGGSETANDTASGSSNNETAPVAAPQAGNGTASSEDSADPELPDPKSISCKNDKGCPKGFACPKGKDGAASPDAKCELCGSIYKDNAAELDKCNSRSDFLTLEPEKKAEGASGNNTAAESKPDVETGSVSGNGTAGAKEEKETPAAGDGNTSPGHAVQVAHKKCIAGCLLKPDPKEVTSCIDACVQQPAETAVEAVGGGAAAPAKNGSASASDDDEFVGHSWIHDHVTCVKGCISKDHPSTAKARHCIHECGDAPQGSNPTKGKNPPENEGGTEVVIAPGDATPEEEKAASEKEEKSLETLASLDKEIDGAGDQKAAQSTDGQVVALARKDQELKSEKDSLAELDKQIALAKQDLKDKTDKLHQMENAQSPELAAKRRELESIPEDVAAAAGSGVAELIESGGVQAQLDEMIKPEDQAARKKALESEVNTLSTGIKEPNVVAQRAAVAAAQKKLDDLLAQREQMMAKILGREKTIANQAGKDVGEDAAKEEETLDSKVADSKKEQQALDKQIQENQHKAATTQDPVQKEKIKQQIAKEVEESNEKKKNIDKMEREMKDLRADVTAIANGQPPPRPKNLLPPPNNNPPDGQPGTKVDMGSQEQLVPLRLTLSGDTAEQVWYDEDIQETVAHAVTESANADKDDAKVVWAEAPQQPKNPNDKPTCNVVLMVTYAVAEHVMNSIASKDNHLGIVFKAIGFHIATAEAGGRSVENDQTKATEYRDMVADHKDFPQHYTDLSMIDYSATGSWHAMWNMPQSPGAFVPKAPSLPPDLQATLVDREPSALIDVFYLHPTTYDSDLTSNADVDDGNVNAQSAMFVRYDASAFNGIARVYAPKFRQASKGTLSDKEGETDGVLETAFTDVAAAFQYYWEHYNNGFGFIIAGHGQGAGLASELLSQVIDKSPAIRERMVAAYLVGYFVPTNGYTNIPECTQPSQTNCYASFVPVADNGNPSDACGSSQLTPYCVNTVQSVPSTATATCTNPLNWQRMGQAAASDNLGSGPGLGPYSSEFNDIIPALVDARCDANGVLRVNDGIAVGDKTAKNFRSSSTGDYTISAYSLFYMNIRQNAGQRADAYNIRHPPNRKKRSTGVIKKQVGVDIKKVAKSGGDVTAAVSDAVGGVAANAGSAVPISGTGVSPQNSVAADKNGVKAVGLDEIPSTPAVTVINTEVRHPVSLRTVAPGVAYYKKDGKIFVNSEFNENSASIGAPVSLWVYCILLAASLLLLF